MKLPPRPGAHPAPAPVVSILLSPDFGYLSPPMRVTTQRATIHSPRPDHHGPPHVAPLPLLSLCACARVSTPGAPHTPRLSLPRHGATEATQRHAVWGGTTLSRPTYRYPRTQGSIAHANKPTPEREHASKQASKRGKGAAGPHCPTTPSKRANTKSANTKRRTRPARKHQTPTTHRANTPTSKPALPPPARTQERPHSSVWAQPSVSARGEPWKSRRPARTKRRRPTRARRQRTQKRANNLVCVRCAPAPAREDSAREGRSQ